MQGERPGDEAFLRIRHADDERLAEVPRAQLEPLRRPLTEVSGQAEAPIAVAYRDHGNSLKEIAEYLGCHYSTVSRRLRAEEAIWRCKT